MLRYNDEFDDAMHKVNYHHDKFYHYTKNWPTVKQFFAGFFFTISRSIDVTTRGWKYPAWYKRVNWKPRYYWDACGVVLGWLNFETGYRPWWMRIPYTEEQKKEIMKGFGIK
tara:strand:+ start:641 stop:976 length:336 start_codon:yes stop_codon:yes gene_type:complete